MPAAFHEHASGLIVPTEMARVRKVLPKALWKLLDRVTLELHAVGIRVKLECTNPDCKDARFEAKYLSDGSYRLRCPHADYVMVKHV